MISKGSHDYSRILPQGAAFILTLAVGLGLLCSSLLTIVLLPPMESYWNQSSLTWVNVSSPSWLKNSSPSWLNVSTPSWMNVSSPSWLKNPSPSWLNVSTPSWMNVSSPSWMNVSSFSQLKASLSPPPCLPPTCFMLSEDLTCRNRDTGKFSQGSRGRFEVLYNHIMAKKFFNCNESVTYTTHGDHRVMDNLEPLLKRWAGPISVSVYAPGDDYKWALSVTSYYRQCSPMAEDITNLVTFHLFFDKDHPPNTGVMSNEDLEHFKINCTGFDVQRLMSVSYKESNQLEYPINVARNVAREAANTYFIFSSDIELYPSPGQIPAFLDMIRRNGPKIRDQKVRRVFVNLLFEIENDTPLPDNKTELIQLYDSQMVVPFHQKVCDACANIPEFTAWRNSVENGPLDTFYVAKTEGEFQHWAPVFISTHAEPLFDERLTWDGRSERMTQIYELCSKDYDFHILNNAFLIHRPGIMTEQEVLEYKNQTKVDQQTKLILEEIIPEIEYSLVNDTMKRNCSL